MLRGDLATQRELIQQFTAILPSWLRRCGVGRANLADAVQEASVEVLTRLQSGHLGGTEAQTRYDLMRIVSNVALRTRRRLRREGERNMSIERVELPTTRDEEAWVAARAVVLTALGNLDKATRDLIYAHEVEGKTNGEIAADLNLKEDAVEKRVYNAKHRLRVEIERIEQGRRHWGDEQSGRNRNALLLGVDFDFSDPFDRALFQSAKEAFVPRPFFPTELLDKVWNFVRPNVATTALMSVLALAPNSLSMSTPMASVAMMDAEPISFHPGPMAMVEDSVAAETSAASLETAATSSNGELARQNVSAGTMANVVRPSVAAKDSTSVARPMPRSESLSTNGKPVVQVEPSMQSAESGLRPLSKKSTRYCPTKPGGQCGGPQALHRNKE